MLYQGVPIKSKRRYSFLKSHKQLSQWRVLISYCHGNKTLQIQWLKECQILNFPFWRPTIWNGVHWAKTPMLAGLCSFCRLWGDPLAAFSSFQRLPAFFGSWPLPPSSKPGSSNRSLTLSLPSSIRKRTLVLSGALRWHCPCPPPRRTIRITSPSQILN